MSEDRRDWRGWTHEDGEAGFLALSEAISTAEADLKVAQSRAAAYQATCHAQGKKLLDIEKVVKMADMSTKEDTPLRLRSIPNPYLDAIRKILIRKGNE